MDISTSSSLSMKPTGWFMVGLSGEVKPGTIVRKRYFDRELVLWRSTGGSIRVFDAHCEHLGAHLGYGGHVDGDKVVCPFHGWEWDNEGRNVYIPYQPNRPNRARRIRSWHVVERNEAIFISHDVEGGTPLYQVPDAFEELFDGNRCADDYYPAYPKVTFHRERVAVHPQFVSENAIDLAHFKFVHRAVEIPRFTRFELDDYHLYADLQIIFGGRKKSTIQTPGGAVDGAINVTICGIGLTYVGYSGPDNQRSIVAVTPVDENTSDVFNLVWLDRLPGDDSMEPPESMNARIRLAQNNFLADLNILEHQRYTDPPGLATMEGQAFRSLRSWAIKFYPEKGKDDTPDSQARNRVRSKRGNE